MTDIRYWVGLSLVPEVGPVMSRKLISEIGNPANIFRAGEESALPVHTVLNLLLSLELKGVVRQSNGKRFYLL